MKIPRTIIKKCADGNKCACKLARKIAAMYASSVVTFADAEKVTEHSNKLPFKGVLLRVDEPSDKAPHGSELHRIYVSRSVVDDKLPTLVGMAVNYDASDMDSHDTKHKVGVITSAWRTGKDVWVSGYAWAKDFPEVKEDLKRKDLGMSMELGNVEVNNENSNIWKLDDFEFTGATILKRDAAAYNRTSLQASKHAQMLLNSSSNRTAAAKAVATVEGAQMKKPKVEKKKVAAANSDTGQDNGSLALLAQAITSGLKEVGNNIVSEIKASNAQIAESLEDVKNLHFINASAQDEDEEDDEVVLNAGKEEDDDDDDMAAASDEDDDMAAASDDDDDDMAAGDDASDDSSDDDSSASQMEAMEDLETDPADQEPGEINKDSKNKGRKNSVTKPPKQGAHFPDSIAKGRLAAAKGAKMKKPFPSLAAAAVQVNELHASNRKMRRNMQAMQETHKKETLKLRKSIKAMGSQLERFTELEGRRSAIPTELVALAGKAGYDLREIKASGQKMNTSQVDAMFEVARQQGINIPVQTRMGMKNLLVEQGMMADDVVDRGYGRPN